MARSMTGFGSAHRHIAGADYEVEIRSVNGRYFRASIHLPEQWSALEPEIDRKLRERFYRGSVNFVLRMRFTSAEAAYEVNTAALERYVEQLDVVRPDQTDVQLRIDMAALLLLPGVCTPPATEELRARAGKDLTALIDEVIEQVLQMRTREGQAITRDLFAHCQTIAGLLSEIAGRAPVVVQDYHKRLKRRVEELAAGAELNLSQQDLAREVAAFAERCDIAEEVSRLAAHVAQFRAVLSEEDRPGRKLDFIAQEMLREANTIAAKANDADIARWVVDIKTAVDRIKEQVQNVE